MLNWPERFGWIERSGAYGHMGRSTYEPPDDIHVFDGAEDDDDVEGSRLPLLIVIALFVLAAFAGVVYLAYTQGVARGHSDVPRIIAAQPGPAKVAANDEQGNSGPASFKGLKIYQKPAPSDDAADRQVTPPPPSPDQTVEPENKPATPPKTKIATPKTETAAVKEPPLSVAKSLTLPVTAPVTKPAPPPVSEKVATVEPAPEPVKTTAPAGAYVLQIGAYKSEEDAATAWRTYHASMRVCSPAIRKTSRRSIWGGRGRGTGCVSVPLPTRTRRRRCARS